MNENDIYVAIENYLNTYTSVKIDNILRAYPSTRVHLPNTNNYIIMTLTNSNRLSTPSETYIENLYNVTQDKQATMQIDFFGPLAEEWAERIENLSRSSVACDFLKEYCIQPLYCDDAVNNTIVSGEKQYVSRWTVQLHLTYFHEVSVEYDGFSEVKLNLLKTEL